VILRVVLVLLTVTTVPVRLLPWSAGLPVPEPQFDGQQVDQRPQIRPGMPERGGHQRVQGGLGPDDAEPRGVAVGDQALGEGEVAA
jgi:hypothetical protein